jgi:hypothetical protein
MPSRRARSRRRTTRPPARPAPQHDRARRGAEELRAVLKRDRKKAARFRILFNEHRDLVDYFDPEPPSRSARRRGRPPDAVGRISDFDRACWNADADGMTTAEIIRIIGREPSSAAYRLVRRAIARADSKRNQAQRVPIMRSRNEIVVNLTKHAPPIPPDPLA